MAAFHGVVMHQSMGGVKFASNTESRGVSNTFAAAVVECSSKGVPYKRLPCYCAPRLQQQWRGPCARALSTTCFTETVSAAAAAVLSRMLPRSVQCLTPWPWSLSPMQLPVPKCSELPALNYRFNGFLESALLAPTVRGSQLRLRTDAGQSCPEEGGCAASAPAACEEGGRPPTPGRSGPSSLRLPSGEVAPPPTPACMPLVCPAASVPEQGTAITAFVRTRIPS